MSDAEERYIFEERAAILEYDAGMPREESERLVKTGYYRRQGADNDEALLQA